MDPLQLKVISIARRSRLLSGFVNTAGRSRARKMLRELAAWLPAAGGRVLDIGAGTGHMAEAVAAAGHKVTACDLVDLRFVPLELVIADGARLPFACGSFDASLLITVLHHVPAALHEAMLGEAHRVLRPGGRLLLLEDTYHSAPERLLTLTLDSAMNFEFFNHPHSNRSLAEWRELLRRLGLRLAHAHEFNEWYGPLPVRHALMVVERDRKANS